jgi:hypothetical protein
VRLRRERDSSIETGLSIADTEVEFWVNYLKQLTPRGLVGVLMHTRDTMAESDVEDSIYPTQAVVRWFLQEECSLPTPAGESSFAH